MALINQNYIDEEMEGSLNSQIACLHLVQSFSLPMCYIKTMVQIYNTIGLPVLLYGCETWSFTLREEC